LAFVTDVLGKFSEGEALGAGPSQLTICLHRSPDRTSSCVATRPTKSRN